VGPTVSVCIPAFRRPAELRNALESVLIQSFTDFEVVVGDDSGDLEDVVRSVNDRRIRYLMNERRLGMVGNWTHTLDAATGRYRMLLMDDDSLLPDFLATTVPVLDADPSVGVAYTNNVFVCGPSQTVRSCGLTPGRHHPFLRTLLLHAPGVAISGALMRAEVWDQVKPLPNLLSADLVMFIRAALRDWAFYYVDAPLMRYGVHAGQQTGQPDRFRSDIVEAWNLFEFGDRECELLRRRHLADALVNRAAEHLRAGRSLEARADTTRASTLVSEARSRHRALATLARAPVLVRPAQRAWRMFRRVRPAAELHFACLCRRGTFR
jgi:glycosyltransferase involved in cell wall biosynthesis